MSSGSQKAVAARIASKPSREMDVPCGDVRNKKGYRHRVITRSAFKLAAINSPRPAIMNPSARL